ncbi:VOC family protein [Alicyclobacillus herbarius]|nr:VOC family protein [Alicyclobacillus herbarius]
MTALKPHVAINVRDFERSLTFYRTFFGLDPVGSLRRPPTGG